MYYIVKKGTIDALGTGRAIFSNFSRKTWETERGAKIALTRLRKKHGEDKFADAEIIDQATFNERDVMVEVKSLMSGKMVKIRLSDRGGCCDPSTERYWSM